MAILKPQIRDQFNPRKPACVSTGITQTDRLCDVFELSLLKRSKNNKRDMLEEGFHLLKRSAVYLSNYIFVYPFIITTNI